MNQAAAPAISIADLCGPVLKLGLNLAKEGANADAATLGSRFDDALAQFEAEARRADVPLADVRAAKYALVALADQQVLTSELAAKDAWLEKPLQVKHFDDFNAGEEFYVKLEQMRNSTDPGRFAVMEVYHLCLSLGFTGKFGDKRGEEQRRILIDRVAREIADARPGTAGPLAPSALRPGGGGEAASAWWSRLPAWLPPGVAALVAVLIWLLASALLSGAADGFPASALTRSAP
jgi:type VI secretion system protein ImpK